MSFSSGVKNELAGQISRRRHCQLAQFAALFAFAGQIRTVPEAPAEVCIRSDNRLVAQTCAALLYRLFGYRCTADEKENPYILTIDRPETAMTILQALKLVSADGCLTPPDGLVHPLLIQQDCCQRSFLKGAFLAAGSISDPSKSYHFEIVCAEKAKAEQLMEILDTQQFSLTPRLIVRKNHYVVYIKEGEQISTLLGMLDAPVALMEFENARILRGIANQVNRTNNCDVANMKKTITASSRQQEDILYIQRTIGLGALPENLRELAALRLEQTDIPLQQLGEQLSPPIGKSGVNHRLRRISQIAQDLREGKSF